jgi:hypothetical protein
VLLPWTNGKHEGLDVRADLLKRRTQFLNAFWKGSPLKETVDQFSDDYDVAPKTLYNDWAKRREWLPHIMQLQDPSVFLELCQGLRETLRSAWLMQITSANESVRIAALKLAKDTYVDFYKIIKDLTFKTRDALESKQALTELAVAREREQKILEDMSEEQLRDLINALKPFEGVRDFSAE